MFFVLTNSDALIDKDCTFAVDEFVKTGASLLIGFFPNIGSSSSEEEKRLGLVFFSLRIVKLFDSSCLSLPLCLASLALGEFVSLLRLPRPLSTLPPTSSATDDFAMESTGVIFCLESLAPSEASSTDEALAAVVLSGGEEEDPWCFLLTMVRVGGRLCLVILARP